MNPWMAIIGAALGAIRSSNEQREMNRQRETEVTREMWSPWTGRHGKDVGNSDAIGRMMQGGMAGASFGQQFGEKNTGPGEIEPLNVHSSVPLSGSRLSAPSQMPVAPMQQMQNEMFPNMYRPQMMTA